MKDRPCFKCGKAGHRSFECPEKDKRPGRRPVNVVEGRRQHVMMIGNKETSRTSSSRHPAPPPPIDADGFSRPRRPVPQRFADSFQPARVTRKGNNRYRSLREDDEVCRCGCDQPGGGNCSRPAGVVGLLLEKA